MERNGYLIKKKFYKYLLPGIMMMAALQLGNLVDSIFVGNFLESICLSAMNLAQPVVFFAQIPMMVFSLGGSTVAGIKMGERKMKEASSVFSATLVIVVVFNIILAIAGIFFAEPLSIAFAGGSSIYAMTSEFMLAYLLEMPVLAFVMLLGYYMNVDGHPEDTAVMHIAANIINLLADVLYLKVMNTGVAGSALSTGTGYALAGIFFLIKYIRSPKRQLSFSFKLIKGSGKLIKESIPAGAPAGCMILLPALRMFILNPTVLNMTGDEGMTIYSICTNSLFFVQMCTQGIISVIQTVGGVLFGEKDYFGLRVILRQVTKYCVCVSVALTVLFLIFPSVVAGAFGFDSSGTNCDTCIRILGLSSVFYSLNLLFQTYYATIQRASLALINAALQGVVLVIPVTLILLSPMGVPGAMLAMTISEAGAVLIVSVIRILLQKKGRLPGKTYAVLPEMAENQYIDITAAGITENVSEISRKMKEYCLENGIDEYTSNIVAVAADELFYVISQYLSKYDGMPEEKKSVDLCLSRVGDSVVLRARDDGPPFNPLNEIEKAEANGPIDFFEDTQENESGMDLLGLKLLKGIAERVEYTRTLNMNNTVVEIKIRDREVV